MSEQNIERIMAYLAGHADQYGLDVLRDQLIAAGYAQSDVETAIARFRRPAEPAPVDATIRLPAEPSAPPSTTEEPAADTAPPTLPLGDPSDRQAEIGRARAYIEANHDRYEVEALRGALLQSGYPQDVIEAALAQIGKIRRPRKTKAAGSGPPPAWPFGILVAFGNYVLISVFIGIDVQLEAGGILFGVATLLLFGGEIVAWLLWRGGPRDRVGRALGLGALFTVLFTFGTIALLALLIGACIALLGGF